MSFAVPRRIIDEGDTVVLYFSVVNMHSIEIKRQILNNKGQLVSFC